MMIIIPWLIYYIFAFNNDDINRIMKKTSEIYTYIYSEIHI